MSASGADPTSRTEAWAAQVALEAEPLIGLLCSLGLRPAGTDWTELVGHDVSITITDDQVARTVRLEGNAEPAAALRSTVQIQLEKHGGFEEVPVAVTSNTKPPAPHETALETIVIEADETPPALDARPETVEIEAETPSVPEEVPTTQPPTTTAPTPTPPAEAEAAAAGLSAPPDSAAPVDTDVPRPPDRPPASPAPPAAASPSPSLSCTSCGQAMGAGDRFCEACGSRAVAPTQDTAAPPVADDANQAPVAASTPHDSQARASAAPTCSSCGHGLESDDQFCEMCGTPVAEPEAATSTPSTAALSADRAASCTSCGRQLPTGDRFCEMCGTPVS